MNDERTIAGRYRLLERVGNGAMGTVSRAFDQTLRRTVAVKEVHVPGGLTGQQNDELVRRTMREGRIAARLHHPRLITVYDVVEDGGRPYLIMEYFPSRSLKALGTLPWASAAWLGAQAAEALASAHASGVVHRDVKPANILVGDDAAVKITDFGVSRVVEDLTATMTGMFAGTPAYLAPEVAKGGQATFASDVYSLGATIYAVIEGTSPVGDTANPMGLLYRVASGEINKPRRAGPLTDVLMWLLAADPAARPTMAQASKALSANASKPTLPLPAALPATESVAPESVAAESVAAESVAAESVAPESVAAEAAAAQVAAAATRVAASEVQPEPATTEPATSEPATSQPAASEPAVSEGEASEWRAVPPVEENSPPVEEDSHPVAETDATTAVDSQAEADPTQTPEPEVGSAEPDSGASPTEAATTHVESPAGVGQSAAPAAVMPNPAPAPSRPNSSPTAASAPPPRKTSRARIVGIAAGLVVVALLAALVTTLLNKGDDPEQNPVAQPKTSSSTTTGEEASPEPTTTTNAPTTTTTTPPPNTTQPQPPPQQQPASAAAAISDYYTLVPGNLDEAWNRLTPRFQNGHAGGRGGFANWWNKISSVEVSGVTETGANTVEATVLYHFKDGHNTEERHRYTVVNTGGTWLIDAQVVISSRNV